MKAIDLFCGCGGFSLGMGRAGFDVLRAWDFDANCVEQYNRHVGDHAVRASISDIEGEIAGFAKGEGVDMIFGGPPCQDFSTIGLRSERDRADLTMSFVRVFLASGAKWGLMENVRNAKNSATYRNAMKALNAEGVSARPDVLIAADFGVPQSRIRLFTFLSRDHVLDFGDGPDYRKFFLPRKTVAEYYDDQGDPFGRETFLYIRGGYAHVKRVHSAHALAPTITCNHHGRIAPGEKRYNHNLISNASCQMTAPLLTTDDLSRIQSFPMDWKWDGFSPKGVAAKMIGNAVPPLMAEGVGKAAMDFIQRKERKP